MGRNPGCPVHKNKKTPVQAIILHRNVIENGAEKNKRKKLSVRKPIQIDKLKKS
jgi:hypothetical protein